MSKDDSSRTTVYLDPKIKKGAQFYAIRDNTSLSAIINNKLFEYLEDQADIAVLKDREKDAEFMPLEQVLKELGLSEKDLQNSNRKTR